ncbi:polysaccharide deacetylase family protein [Candidatus Nitronereus thalassa]|uniref:Polysaccharide deacetylase family protein n=1 Tax=Candidatus Nitronereus thalassa TaxID=3020898 RepID=A0ABU3K597_9BACT|nr:polysaccharide deacetylase family protein [Candidatus Nitronereus thalassa]MDT7041544.1 polysaccharide deacetylase family protein [Candidatus Nitronereus thalassa]
MGIILTKRMLLRYIGKCGRKFAEVLPLSAYRIFMRREVTGLNYHIVSDQDLPHIKYTLPYKSHKQFENDLTYLKSNYKLLSYSQVEELILKNTREFENSVILTFDDGYSECYSVVMPLLKKHNIPCMFFVTSEVIDNKFMVYPNKMSLIDDVMMSLDDVKFEGVLQDINHRFKQNLKTRKGFLAWMGSLHYSDTPMIDEMCVMLNIDVQQYLKKHQPYLTSQEIKRLVQNGFTVGAHGQRHAYLYTLKTRKQIEEEIVTSCRVIKEVTGQEKVPFAFPFSADYLDREFLEDVVKRYDFIGLLFDMREFKKDRSFIVNRIWGDDPEGCVEGKSNVQHLFHRAYRNHSEKLFEPFLRGNEG